MIKKHNMTALCAVILLVSAVPALAIHWQGTGTGQCNLPDGSSVFPWQLWEGEDNGASYIYGYWKDEKGNYGHFYSKSMVQRKYGIVYSGEWTWFDPSLGAEVLKGEFQVFCNYFTDACSGTWNCPTWPIVGAPTISGAIVP